MRKTNSQKGIKKVPLSYAINWLKISEKMKEKNREKVLAVEVDYLQYTCYDVGTCLRSLYGLGFTGEIDVDNSNVCFNQDYTLSLTNMSTRM